MKVAAENILCDMPVEFLTPEEIQKAVDEHNAQQDQLAAQYNVPPHLRPGNELSTFFGCCFVLAKWLFLLLSGLVIPYLIYKAGVSIFKSIIKSGK